jgi:hypothetical protein
MIRQRLCDTMTLWSLEKNMVLSIDFPSAVVEQLKAEAAASGKDVESIVREAVGSTLARRKRTFAEVLAPIHDAIEASGMTPDEATDFLDSELAAMRSERRESRSKP